ncbi:MAG: PAS domain S-box protein [Ktedonobacteraceae bacterium]|nr:PAS domain S-box protein [Ktedonobacteraceae bacterium]MBV9712977.1 PAS domain S-box protein [Ktedonobacteraceae bacterium]
MPDVEQQWRQIQAADIVRVLLNEFGALAEYRVLRDSLPGRLATLLRCRCVLLYQRVGETLQLVAGSFEDEPGWSASLLAVAHINPINLSGNGPEASAWRERHGVVEPQEHPTLVALPLMYRHRGMGVMVALRGKDGRREDCAETWMADEVSGMDVIADVVALLLENTRLLERDRERIHELSLLNSISNQMNGSMYEQERLKNIIVQRAKEISLADLCMLIEPAIPENATSWMPATLRELLLQHFQRRQAPLMIERPGDGNDSRIADYLQQLPVEVKTFFAFPLTNSQEAERRNCSPLGTSRDVAPEVLGIIVGAYHHVQKLRREEIVLLQVLANQASAVLKNIQLMAEVMEARNEARKLLRQVLDDQRLKELILASIPSGLITTDLKGHIVTFNRAAETILGYSPYEVLGQPLQKFLHLQAASFLNNTTQDLEATRQIDSPEGGEKIRQMQRETLVTLDRHGQEVILDVATLPLWRDPGERIGVLITFVDMTSVHRLEEEKRRLDRLAALGEMSANVAHEVRNPLASIKTAMQMLAGELVSSQVLQPACYVTVADQVSSSYAGEQKGQSIESSVREGALESIDVVLKEVERLDTIVRELLQFARPRQLHRSPCNIVELSDRVLQLLHHQYSKASVVVRRIYASVPLLNADVAQMEQVLLNLYMNAIQAMPDGGILTVACHLISKEQALHEARGRQSAPACLSAGEAGEPGIYMQPGCGKEQQWLELAVSDTGPGIAPDQAERIFQPFFTTRAHGIGLGLAITRRLVEDHGGYIWVGGHFGYGATISVRLPLVPEQGGEDESD